MSFEFATVVERPDTERRHVELAAHEARSEQASWRVAELGPGLAEEREEYRLNIAVETDRGHVALPLPLRIVSRESRKGTSYRLTGTQYRLTLTIKVRPDERGEIHWRLEPGGEDASGRAAILDLLIALSGDGVMTLTDPDHGAVAMAYLQHQPMDESLLLEREFLSDVLAIEAWSGRRFVLPKEVDEADSLAVTEAAHLVRSREYRFRFVGPITAKTDSPIDRADELRLGEDLRRMIFGVWVFLGHANFSVRVRAVKSERATGSWTTEFESLDDRIVARIAPPHGRRSTQGLRLVDEGKLPKPPPANTTKRRSAALEAAQEFVELHERENGPVSSVLADEVRQLWPP